MADEHQMLIEHQRTWKGFLRLLIWSCVSIAIVLIGMAIFLL
jgi:hypothetical protein